MQHGDCTFFEAAEPFLFQTAPVALAEQSNKPFWIKPFWITTLLLHFEDYGDPKPLTRFGPVFQATDMAVSVG